MSNQREEWNKERGIMFKIKEKGVTEYSPSFGVRLRTTSYDGEPLKSNTLSIYLGKRYWYIEVPYFLKHHKKWEDLSKYDWATSDGYWDNFDKEYGKGKETWKGGTIGAYIPIDEYNGDIDVILKTKGMLLNPYSNNVREIIYLIY